MRNFSSGAYVNFPDPSLTTWQQDYYGANLSRLESIKAQVDPLLVFHFPQSIPPASTMARRSTLREALSASARRALARAAYSRLPGQHGIRAAIWSTRQGNVIIC